MDRTTIADGNGTEVRAWTLGWRSGRERERRREGVGEREKAEEE